jgi:hypothetical protein
MRTGLEDKTQDDLDYLHRIAGAMAATSARTTRATADERSSWNVAAGGLGTLLNLEYTRRNLERLLREMRGAK